MKDSCKTNFLHLKAVDPNVGRSSLPFHKKGGRLRTPSDAKLLKDVGQVVLDGLVAESERDGDFLVGLSLGNQRNDSFFLRGQLVRTRGRWQIVKPSQPPQSPFGHMESKIDCPFATERMASSKAGESISLRT